MKLHLLYTDTFGYELDIFTNQEAAHEAAVLLSEKRAYRGETVEVHQFTAAAFRHALKPGASITFTWNG